MTKDQLERAVIAFDTKRSLERFKQSLNAGGAVMVIIGGCIVQPAIEEGNALHNAIRTYLDDQIGLCTLELDSYGVECDD